MNRLEIPTLDWTDSGCVSQYLGVYGELCDAAIPQQLDRIGDLTSKTFVDLGCGQGTLLIKDATVAEECIGVDISPKMCELVRGKADAAGLSNVSVVCCTFLEWNVPSESVDVAWTRSAVHHLPDDEKGCLFRDLHRALRPAGRFLMDDLMFQFGYGDYERQLPAIAEILLQHVNRP